MNSPENTVRAYFDAFNRSDVDSIVSVFTEDGLFRTFRAKLCNKG